MSAHFLIAGAGQAGVQAAFALRACKFTERITLLGDEERLPYERPPLSKAVLCGHAEPNDAGWGSREDYLAAGIDLRLNVRVTNFDPLTHRVELSTGERLGYDRLLLALGATPRRLHIAGSELPNVHYVRTAEDALALRGALEPGTRVAVIGAGFIGLEVAASAVGRGCNVTVVESESRILKRIATPFLSDFVARLHRDRGVDIRVSSSVLAILGHARVEAVQLASERIPCDVVVIGVGAAPNCATSMAAGLAVDNGVVVDECCRTSAADIYAAGDMTNGYNVFMGRHVHQESWHNAESQASVAAHSMCDQPVSYDAIPWFWTDQYGVNIQIINGQQEPAESVIRHSMEQGGSAEFLLRGEHLVGAILIDCGRLRRVVEQVIAKKVPVLAGRLKDTQLDLRTTLRAALDSPLTIEAGRK